MNSEFRISSIKRRFGETSVRVRIYEGDLVGGEFRRSAMIKTIDFALPQRASLEEVENTAMRELVKVSAELPIPEQVAIRDRVNAQGSP